MSPTCFSTWPLILSILSIIYSSYALSPSILGKVAVWHPINDVTEVDNTPYITKTSYISDVKRHLSQIIPTSELIIKLKPSSKDLSAGKSLFSYPSVQESIQTSRKLVVYSNVYQDDKEKSNDMIKVSRNFQNVDEEIKNPTEEKTSIEASTDFFEISHESFSQSTTATFEQLIEMLKSNSLELLENNKVDVIEVELYDASEDAFNKQYFNELFTINRSPMISFIAIQQPSMDAYAPSVQAIYRRSLSSDNVTYIPTTSSLYYKPEGTEFSIYYADTYLYITPDIFTGILTTLFIIAVLYIGFTCLDAVKGASSFVMKPIPLGKEY